MSGRSKKTPSHCQRHRTSLGNLDRWLIAQPQTQAIVGARNAQQATANALAADIQLSADELQEIDAIGRITDIWTTTQMWNWNS